MTEAPTSNFDFLDCFIALVVDFDFNWDGFTVKVELCRIRKVIVHCIWYNYSIYLQLATTVFAVDNRTSLSIDASR